MLRRTKDMMVGEWYQFWMRAENALTSHPRSQDGKPILILPKRTVEVISCEFDADERAFYDAVEKRIEMTFNKV
jgi:hypothetical protein